MASKSPEEEALSRVKGLFRTTDISEYIATNLISITDGQIYTSKKLFIDL